MGLRSLVNSLPTDSLALNRRLTLLDFSACSLPVFAASASAEKAMVLRALGLHFQALLVDLFKSAGRGSSSSIRMARVRAIQVDRVEVVW